MLATLNLQLSPVELLDDTNLTPVTPAPGATGTVSSGFADLLRLPNDVAWAAEDASGALLPQGGSNLPLDTESALTEAVPLSLPALTVDSGLINSTSVPLVDDAPVEIGLSGLQLEAGDPALQLAAVDLELETLVVYPPSHLGETADSGLLTGEPTIPVPSVSIAELLSANAVGRRESGSESRRPDAAISALRLDARGFGGPATAVPMPIVDSPEVLARNVAGDVLAPAHLGLRERGQGGEAANRSAPLVITETTIDGEQRAPLPDPARQLDFASLQRVEGRIEPVTEMPQHRLAVPQAAQTPQSQINPQTLQSALSPVANTSADFTYASVAQQSTDLIGTSVRDTAWGERIGERVVMMAGNHLKQAEIRLTPAELGPLRVQVSVDDGATHVTFHAQHAVTRDALEQALPRLREMLAENGLSLGQADVSERGVDEGSRDDHSEHGASDSVADDMDGRAHDIAQDSVQRPITSNGLLDTFV